MDGGCQERLHQEEDLLSSLTCVREDELEPGILFSDEDEEESTRLPRRRKTPSSSSSTGFSSEECSSQRKKTSEVYTQLKKQYLAARMYGGYEGGFFFVRQLALSPLLVRPFLVSLLVLSSLLPLCRSFSLVYRHLVGVGRERLSS